jgi:hypothetical protein
MKSQKGLQLKDAVRAKSAELWLRMGQPTEALLELQHIPKRAWRHPWIENIVWRAAHALG